MIKVGKCPKCEKVCTTIKLQEVDASAGVASTTWRAVTYLCPHCNTILSVGLDPITLKNDTATAVAKLLKGGN